MEKENNQLKDIKKLYNQCEVWVNSHDSSKLEMVIDDPFIVYDSTNSITNSFVNLKDTFHWFKEMSELSDGDKNILFGETLLTIEDIKERILKHLKELRNRFKEEDSSDYNDEEDEDVDYDGDYDEDGHASLRGYKSVVEFFESLDGEKLMSIANGSVQYYYEVDIDGGRSYLMSGSNIYLYIFNYLYYTKKLTLEEYEDGIFNSGDASELIEEFYLENFYLPSDEEFDEMYKISFRKRYQKSFDRYNSLINNIIREFDNDLMFSDLLSEIKKLKVDDALIQSKVISGLREYQIDKII